jgi:hypothetical protein
MSVLNGLAPGMRTWEMEGITRAKQSPVKNRDFTILFTSSGLLGLISAQIL